MKIKLKGQTIECQVEKLIFGGSGLSRYQNKVVFAYNALPGETIRARVYFEKRDYAEALTTEVLEPSAFRQAPLEAHFLSCSPWQILAPAQETHWKQVISQEVFRHLPTEDWSTLKLVEPEERFGYRNKIEFSFVTSEDQLSLAFFQRGAHHKQCLEGCVLARPSINAVAQNILTWLRSVGVQSFMLKSLILRANRQDEVLAALFVTDSDFPRSESWEFDPRLKGFLLYYSNPQSPAAIPTQLLEQRGSAFLQEQLGQRTLSYGPLSFFQVNVPLFEQVLANIRPFVAGEAILDYYCGVGAIGLALAQEVKSCVAVDESEESILYAQTNIREQGLTNFRAECSKAEKLLEFIDSEHVLILDPPRAGLHPKVLKRIVQERPPRIVYLSCNISTCARDLEALLPLYEVRFKELYNFFPATPHIEFLIILDKKAVL